MHRGMYWNQKDMVENARDKIIHRYDWKCIEKCIGIKCIWLKMQGITQLIRHGMKCIELNSKIRGAFNM